MDKIDALALLLCRLHLGENSDIIKQEADNYLMSLSLSDLLSANHKFIEAGLGDLFSLCLIPALNSDDKTNVPLTDKIINSLMNEHDVMLELLRKLEKVNANIQVRENKDDLKELRQIAKILCRIDLHHKQEEDYVFPVLQKKGFDALIKIMQMEHVDLHIKIHALKTFADFAEKVEPMTLKKNLDPLIQFIIYNHQKHMTIEKKIIYPIVVKIIHEECDWQSSQHSNQIGYSLVPTT